MFFSFCFFIAIFLSAHKIPVLRRKLKPSRFETVQRGASILCSAAPLVMLPQFFDFEKVSGEIGNYNGDKDAINQGVTSSNFMDLYVTELFLNSVSGLIIIALTHFFFEHVGLKYGDMLLEELKRAKEIAQDGSTGEKEDQWRSVDMLFAFHASFCLPYTPEAKNHEQVAFTRRISLTCGIGVARIVQKTLIQNAIFIRGTDMLVLGNPEVKEDLIFERVSLVTTAMLTIFVVSTHTNYLKSLLRKPFLSPRPSTQYGDVVNDTEVFITRAFVWASLVLALRMLATEMLGKESDLLRHFFTNGLCIGLLFVLIWQDRKLFTSVFAPSSKDDEMDSRLRVNSAFSNNEQATSIIVEIMNSYTQKKMLLLLLELIPLVEGMEPKEKQRYLALIKPIDQRKGMRRHRWYRVYLKVKGMFVLGLVIMVSLLLCVQIGFLASKYTNALLTLIVLDCLMVARFEWWFIWGRALIDKPVEEKDEINEEERDGGDIEMSSKLGQDERTESTFSYENPMRRKYKDDQVRKNSVAKTK